MKPLNLKEIALKEEMKERCLAKGQYIDENAKAKFEMLCHLEDFEVQYWELQQENKQLKGNWNKIKEYFNERIEVCDNRLSSPFCNLEKTTKERLIFSQCLEKLEELEQESDDNVKD